MSEAGASPWYARAVLGVSDVGRSVAFYTAKLGFREAWRHVEDGKALVAQVECAGCELIVSSQWPDRTGRGVIFISIEPVMLDALRADIATRGVAVRDGRWGYRLMVVADPDGNELWFSYPAGT